MTENSENIDGLTDDENAPDSLLGALIIAARHRGIRLTATQVVRDYQLGGTDITPAELVRVAEKSGLRSTITRLRWTDLFKLGKALPAIVMLRNGGAMVMVRVVANPESERPRVIVLEDPNGQPDAPLILDEGRFTAACTGEVILVKRDFRLRDENRPFGFGWVVGLLLHDRRIVRDLAICASHEFRGAGPNPLLAPADRPGDVLRQHEHVCRHYRRLAGAIG